MVLYSIMKVKTTIKKGESQFSFWFYRSHKKQLLLDAFCDLHLDTWTECKYPRQTDRLTDLDFEIHTFSNYKKRLVEML